MIHSAEIRWFVPAPPPEAFANLLPVPAKPDPAVAVEQRDDLYRVAPGCDVMGLKVRGGGKGLELKALLTAPEPFDWPSPQAGLLRLGKTDQWLKWELSEKDGVRLMRDAREVLVRKRRWLWKYSADGKQIEQVAASAKPMPRSGCNAERTEVTAFDKAWLSLGFEAFGELERLGAILAESVALVFAQATPEQLRVLAASPSLSYPAWLAEQVRNAE